MHCALKTTYRSFQPYPRVLQNGMRIKVGIVKNIPVGIDTMEDFEKFKAMVEG